jgi:hypothetical protein
MKVAFLVVLSTAGCKNVCGDYQYKGVRSVEWCGDVYGTEGRLFDGAPEVAWAELTFRATVPPNQFQFDHGGFARAKVRWSDLLSGDTLGPDRVLGTCGWTDYGDPLLDGDEEDRVEPPVEIELRGHGRGFNLDPEGTRVREVTWHLECGDGIFRLDARDNVKFDIVGTTERLDPELEAWLSQ